MQVITFESLSVDIQEAYKARTRHYVADDLLNDKKQTGEDYYAEELLAEKANREYTDILDAMPWEVARAFYALSEYMFAIRAIVRGNSWLIGVQGHYIRCEE